MRDLDAVGESDTSDDLGQLILALKTAPGFGGGFDELEDHDPGRVPGQRPLCAHRPVPHGGEDAFDRVRGSEMIPVLGGEVEERQERVPVLGQAFGGGAVFDAVLFDEDIDGDLGRRPARGAPDLADVFLHRRLDGFGHLAEEVGGLVEPAPLVSRAGEHFVERLPEAKRAVADRDLGGDGEPAGLKIDEEFPPALGALADADLEADQLLAPFRRGADDNQHANSALSSIRAWR